MYFRLSALLPIAALAAVVAAAPNALEARQGSQCDTGSALCCEAADQPDDPAIASILALLGINIQDLTDLVGVTCSPITIVGGGYECNEQPVCCTNDSFNGVVALGCIPININL